MHDFDDEINVFVGVGLLLGEAFPTAADRHNAALDKMGSIYGAKIFNTGDLARSPQEIAAFGRWLGLQMN